MQWDPVLFLEGVEVCRGGKNVLRDIDLAIPRGSITAVIGPSGAGKTTLLSVLSGARVPRAGRVHSLELGDLADPQSRLSHCRQTAAIHQNYALIGRLSALDNVLLGIAEQRSLLGFFLPLPKPLQMRAANVLAEVGLLSKALVRVDDLSGGERQRVAFARALLREPKLMIADEPFASIDPGLTDHFAASLRSTVERHDMTVVIALHQMNVAMRLADYIVALVGGRIVLKTSVGNVFPDDLDRIFNAVPRKRPPHGTAEGLERIADIREHRP